MAECSVSFDEHGHLLCARNACETTSTHTPARSREQTFTTERQRDCGVIDVCLSRQGSEALDWWSGAKCLAKEKWKLLGLEIGLRERDKRKMTDLRLFRVRELEGQTYYVSILVSGVSFPHQHKLCLYTSLKSTWNQALLFFSPCCLETLFNIQSITDG